MGDYERTASERRGSKRLYTAKENAAIRSSKVMSTLSDDAAASRTKERIEAYGNSCLLYTSPKPLDSRANRNK